MKILKCTLLETVQTQQIQERKKGGLLNTEAKLSSFSPQLECFTYFILPLPLIFEKSQEPGEQCGSVLQSSSAD